MGNVGFSGAPALCVVVWASSLSLSTQQGSKGKFYQGYDGFWVWDEGECLYYYYQQILVLLPRDSILGILQIV